MTTTTRDQLDQYTTGLQHRDLLTGTHVRAADDDSSARTVEGIAVPWNDQIEFFGIREEFAPGSATTDEDNPPQLFWRHREVIGGLTSWQDDKAGWSIAASISDTTQGRDAHTLAKDGHVRKFSLGFVPQEWEERHETSEDGSEVLILRHTKVLVREVSLVPHPAYTSTAVTNVREAPTQEVGSMPTTAPETVQLRTASAESVTELREMFDDLERSMDTRLTELLEARRDETPAGETRTVGQLVRAAVRDQDETALTALNDIQARAYNENGGTTDDTIARNAWVGDLTRLVDEAATLRSLFSTGTLPAEGMNIEYGQLESNTVQVAEQAAEGDDLAYGKVSLSTATAPVKTYGGYTELTRQEIERSSVAILDHHFRAQAIGTGKALNSAFRTFYDTAVAEQVTAGNTVAVPASGTATYTDWLEAVVDAAVKYENLGLAIDGLVVDTTIFKEFVGFTGSDGRPLFTFTNTGTNVVGDLDVRALTGDLASIPVRLNAKQSAAGAAFVNRLAIRSYNSAVTRLQDENVINLSRAFSVYLYSALANEIPAAIVPVDRAA